MDQYSSTTTTNTSKSHSQNRTRILADLINGWMPETTLKASAITRIEIWFAVVAAERALTIQFRNLGRLLVHDQDIVVVREQDVVFGQSTITSIEAREHPDQQCAIIPIEHTASDHDIEKRRAGVVLQTQAELRRRRLEHLDDDKMPDISSTMSFFENFEARIGGKLNFQTSSSTMRIAFLRTVIFHCLYLFV